MDLESLELMTIFMLIVGNFLLLKLIDVVHDEVQDLKNLSNSNKVLGTTETKNKQQ